MQRLLFFIIALLTTSSVPLKDAAAFFWCHNTYTVKGRLKVYDDVNNPEGRYEPVAGIKVRIYNGPFHIQTTHTNANGFFSKTWKSCMHKLDLNIAFIPTTSQVNVAQLMIPNYYKIRPSRRFHFASPGTHDFGTIRYGKRNTKSGRLLKVYHTVTRILAWLKDEHGIDFIKSPGVPTGHIEVGYPSLTPNDTSWYTPLIRLINLKEGDFQPETPHADVLAHEFGHLFQHGYGKWYLNLPDYNGDGDWSYSTEEVPAVANLEGFAIFFESLYMAQQGFDGRVPLIESRLVKPRLGNGGATNHAAFFYDLYDLDEDRDGACHVDRCALPLEEIMTVFAASRSAGLTAFSIADEDMDDFILRYYEIYGDPPGKCDFDELMYLNGLDIDPAETNCDTRTFSKSLVHKPR